MFWYHFLLYFLQRHLYNELNNVRKYKRNIVYFICWICPMDKLSWRKRIQKTVSWILLFFEKKKLGRIVEASLAKMYISIQSTRQWFFPTLCWKMYVKWRYVFSNELSLFIMPIQRRTSVRTHPIHCMVSMYTNLCTSVYSSVVWGNVPVKNNKEQTFANQFIYDETREMRVKIRLTVPQICICDRILAELSDLNNNSSFKWNTVVMMVIGEFCILYRAQLIQSL